MIGRYRGHDMYLAPRDQRRYLDGSLVSDDHNRQWHKSPPPITRLEVIDDTGRALTYPVGEPIDVELSFQDDDRTLKVFVRGRSSHRNIYCPFCSGLVWAPVQFTAHHFDGCPHKGNP